MSDFKFFSVFGPPISNTIPGGELNIVQLFQFITSNKICERDTKSVRRKLGDKKEFNKAKTRRLHFVTPAGVFYERNEKGLLMPSAHFVVDVDGLDSTEEAERIRDIVFKDTRLNVSLAFVSPSGKGVKFFIPFTVDYSRPFRDSFQEAIHEAWNYLLAVYGIEADHANIDVARCCLLSHDANARMRQ